ncbi:PAS domain S-box-containing protein [Phyllobacterium sp. 1468]|uniref:PAS domain-containing protein n=1 Tax=Phyllobacterium sp. 1468 TaxID=2817759 RepID=UPI002862E277|nr:PAS domain S-box-containing protein [Phyllobacterium sp. 1468]
MSQFECAGPSGFGNQGLCPAEDLENLYENAPCGYLSLRPDGRIVKSNATLSSWTGFSQPELIGKKLHELLTIAGRMFYETHFSPLLRMQGFFNEVALDFVTKDGKKLPVLANAWNDVTTRQFAVHTHHHIPGCPSPPLRTRIG